LDLLQLFDREDEFFVDFDEVFAFLEDLLGTAPRRVVCSGEREWGLDWFELVIVGAQEEGVGCGASAFDPLGDWGLGFPLVRGMILEGCERA